MTELILIIIYAIALVAVIAAGLIIWPKEEE